MIISAISHTHNWHDCFSLQTRVILSLCPKMRENPMKWGLFFVNLVIIMSFVCEWGGSVASKFPIDLFANSHYNYSAGDLWEQRERRSRSVVVAETDASRQRIRRRTSKNEQRTCAI